VASLEPTRINYYVLSQYGKCTEICSSNGTKSLRQLHFKCIKLKLNSTVRLPWLPPATRCCICSGVRQLPASPTACCCPW